MTEKEKAKAYDKAIERAKKSYGNRIRMGGIVMKTKKKEQWRNRYESAYKSNWRDYRGLFLW